MMSDRPERHKIKSILNPVTLVTAAILTVGLVLISLVILFFGRNPATGASTIPETTLIPAPTLTPRVIDPTRTPTPTPTSIFFLPEGVIGIGIYVQVTGTGGAGLRMRGEPGLGAAINFSAMDSEVFLVIDGPVTVDGHTWWHLEAPYDRNRNGWSSANFLSPIKEDVD
ncbi:MAG TPA: hypothetical protein PLE10_04385 [Brevefilum sp.]|nr:hypothetical protein [Brevefilum sp.]HOR19053.1 hypothetical protein [Brevefilum sp.]HPL68959.1 hypothetical protein [Brevefilum sp.]